MRTDEEKAKIHYDRWMKNKGPYGWYGRKILNRTGRRNAKWLIRVAELTSSDRILDVGCGTASTLIEIHHRLKSKQVYKGVDISQEMINMASINLKKANLTTDIKLKIASGSNLPFPDSSFDVVVLLTVIRHMSDATADLALKEIRRVLKSSGRFVLTEFKPPRVNWIRDLLKEPFDVQRWRSEGELRKLLKTEGLVKITPFKVTTFWPPLGWIALVARKI